MNFLIWYGIGFATVVITLFIDTLLHSSKDRRIRRAFHELYNVFYKKADFVPTAMLVIIPLLGPLVSVIFAYYIARNWYYGLPTDDDNKKVYPWSGD